MKESFVVIDFGSTNSVAILCKRHENGRVESIQLGDRESQGLYSFPSVVAYTKEAVYAGCIAKGFISRSPRNKKMHFVKFVKRIIGLTYEEYLNLENKDVFGCEVFERDGKPYFRVYENDEVGKSGEEVASEIFKLIKTVADQRNETKVTDCYVTVPANYNDRQREAIMNAATLAGFQVQGLYHEPTGAAMCWCLADSSNLSVMEKTHKILVFDFGGGTLDISVIENISEMNFSVLSVGGNVRLGGSDIDAAIANYFIKSHPDIFPANIRPGGKKYGKFLSLCEEAKIEASVNGTSSFSISQLISKKKQGMRMSLASSSSTAATTENDSGTIPSASENAMEEEEEEEEDEEKYTLLLTQENLGEIIRSEFKSLINKSIDDVIHQSKLECGNFKHVFMVGGSSSLREVKELVKRRFIMATFHNIDAIFSVAQGATMMAKYSRFGIPPWREVVNYSYGLLTPNNQIAVMITRGSPIPSTGSSRQYRTTTDHPDIIRSCIYQIDDESLDLNQANRVIPYDPRTCVKIKEYTFRNNNPQPTGEQEFKITFKVESGGTLQVICHDENGMEVIDRQSYNNLLGSSQ